MACASDDDSNENNSDRASGTLPCEGLAIDCRLAFSGDYVGEVLSDADTTAGDLTIYVNVIGGIEGTAATPGESRSELTGQVNEFGQLEATAADGTEYVGQFAEDHSFSGTWEHPATGANGTITGTPVSANGEPSPGGPGDPSAQAPQAEAVLAAAETACAKQNECGASIDCSLTELGEGVLGPIECRSEEYALYQCINTATCDSLAQQCSAEAELLDNCWLETLLGEPSERPTTGFEPTGVESFDEVTVICAECLPEAQACHDSQACFDYASCHDACPLGELYCYEGCINDYPEGYSVWFDASWCEINTCSF